MIRASTKRCQRMVGLSWLSRSFCLSSNQLITSAIMNIKSEAKLMNYLKTSGSMFNLINYTAFIQQISSLKKSGKPEDSLNTAQYMKLLTGLKEALMKDSDSITPRNLSNLYAALQKSRKHLGRGPTLALYFEITDMLENMLYSVATDLNEIELSETLSLLVRKDRIKPVEGKLVDTAMNKLDTSSLMFVCYLVDHLGWRANHYKNQMHQLAGFILKNKDLVSSFGIKDFSIFLTNFGKLSHQEKEVSDLLTMLVENIDGYLAKSTPEEFGNLCFVIDNLKNSQVYSEAVEKLMEHFDKIAENKDLSKKAVMNMFVTYANFPKREKRAQTGRIYKAMMKIEDFTVEDLKSVVTHYISPRPPIIKDELLEYLGKQLIKLKETCKNTVECRTLVRIMKGMNDASAKQLIFKFEDKLCTLKLFCYDLRKMHHNERISDYTFMMYLCNHLKTMHKDRLEELQPILTRIYIKAFYVLVKDGFIKDPDLLSPSKLATFGKQLRLGLPELETSATLREIFVSKMANFCEAVTIPENMAEINTEVVENTPDTSEQESHQVMKPLTEGEGLTQDSRRLTPPRHNVSFSDLLEYLATHKEDIENAATKLEELNKYCSLADPKMSMMKVVKILVPNEGSEGKESIVSSTGTKRKLAKAFADN